MMIAPRRFQMKIKLKLPIMVVICLITCLCTTTRALSAETAVKPDRKYTFSSDLFTHNIPSWTRVLNDMKGKPDLTYLEIGVYEGRSFFWVMDNILTHPSSRAIAIDTFDGDFEKRFLDNVRHSGHSSKIGILKGFSQQKLRGLKLNSFDLIYIDGDHRSKMVLMDIILSWDLLKDGGILIIDDYKWFAGLPMEQRPEFAVDVFQTLFRDDFQILVKDYQLIVRKAKTPCKEAMGSIKVGEIPLACSRLGPYIYYWKPQKLYDASTNRKIVLNDGEISLIENTLISRKLGFNLEVEKKETDLYKNLLNRLGLHEISVSSKEIGILPSLASSQNELFVSALDETGSTYVAPKDGTYRFMIIGGAYEICSPKSQPGHPEWWGWLTKLLIYKNRPISWTATCQQEYPGPGNWDFELGSWTHYDTYQQAEEASRDKYIDLPLSEGEFLTFVISDCKECCFLDNSGEMYLSITLLKNLPQLK
jgi:predicted O-methyltransferase YrrM